MKKKELGQFYTPENIARFMVEWVLGNKSDELLDPAAGLGVFLTESNKLHPKVNLSAFEVDYETINKLKYKCNFKFFLNETDYLETFFDKKYSAIICNPPYNKFQNIQQRIQYHKDFYDKFNIKLSGYTNAYIYFLLKSINELKDGGRCCYLIPYEFLNTGYGEVVKKYLLELKIIKYIIKFDSKLKLFDDATTTSCILCLEKNNNESIDFVSIDNLEDLKFPFEKRCCKRLKVIDIDYKEKWLLYFKEKQNINYSNLIQLSSIATVKRGIATGNNGFFTFTKKRIRELGLSDTVCSPCITKSNYIEKKVITNKYFKELVDENKSVFVFDGLKANSVNDFEYIRQGEKDNINKSYLLAHRTPWYSLEKKEVAKILISVFSRNKIKVVMNEIGVKNLATFHGLYFNDGVKNDYIINFFCYLLTPVGQEILKLNKREYGDGLNKFEPNDLNKAFVFDVSKLSVEDTEKIKKIYKLIKIDCREKYIQQLNEIFKKYVL